MASAFGAGFGTLLRLRQVNIMGHTIESPLPFLGGEESFPPRGNWPVAEDTYLDVDSPSYAPASSQETELPKAYTAPQEFIPTELPNAYDDIYLNGEPFEIEGSLSRPSNSQGTPESVRRNAQDSVEQEPSATALDPTDRVQTQTELPQPLNRQLPSDDSSKPVTPIVEPPVAPPPIPLAPPTMAPPDSVQPLEQPKESTSFESL
ncbi:MAG: hypothetical protein AAGA67_07600 [Cyanobacteria bacterium P01_F01_bin.153]